MTLANHTNTDEQIKQRSKKGTKRKSLMSAFLRLHLDEKNKT